MCVLYVDCVSISQHRFDRSNSQSESMSSSGMGNVAAAYKNRKAKTSIAELEDGLESLQHEPSGWGDLPSPKPESEIDNGTELWGVPPDDRARSLGDGEGARKSRCKYKLVHAKHLAM